MPLRLSPTAYHNLVEVAHSTHDPRQLHRVLLSDVIDDEPRQWGYHATVWTAPLWRQYLREVHHIQVSRRSVGLAIARRGMA